MQIASRILLVWGVTYPFPNLAASPAYTSMLLAWSVTEVIRYSYFGMNVAASPPDALVWLRYNTFFVLYPMGILSEVWLIVSATGLAGELWQPFEWGLYAILAIYVPGELLFPSPLWVMNTRWVRDANGCRVVCTLYAYDQAEEEGHEEAERGHQEGAVRLGLCEMVVGCAVVMGKSSRVIMPNSICNIYPVPCLDSRREGCCPNPVLLSFIFIALISPKGQ